MASLSGLLLAGGFGFMVGVILIIIGAAFLLLLRGKASRMSAAVVIIGVIIAGLSGVAILLTPSGSTAPPAPPTATIIVQKASTPALFASGESWNSITNTLTVDLVYNSTSNYWAVAGSAGNGVSGKPNYVLFPVKLVRTDSINATYSFPVGIGSIPTFNSLGASPSTYSFVGFTAATSTNPGIWQLYYSVGNLANQKPTVSAPSVSTNVISNGVPVQSFNSATSVLHVSLGGGNSTSAPTLAAEAVQNYTTYPMTVTIGNGSPSVMTIDFVPIAWVA